jgi:hypothetical protein
MNIIWEETISFHPKALAVSEKGILLAFYGNPGGPGDYTGFSTLAVTVAQVKRASSRRARGCATGACG